MYLIRKIGTDFYSTIRKEPATEEYEIVAQLDAPSIFGNYPSISGTKEQVIDELTNLQREFTASNAQLEDVLNKIKN